MIGNNSRLSIDVDDINQFTSDPDLPPWVFILCCIYLACLGLLGFFVNSFVILLFIKYEKLRTEFNTLLVSLRQENNIKSQIFSQYRYEISVSDLLIAVLGVSMDFTAALQFGWKMGKGPCIFLGFVLTFLGMFCINILSCITFFRWLTLHADSHHLFNDKKRVVRVMIVYSLILSTVLSTPPLMGFGHFLPEENGMSCAPSWKRPEDTGYNVYLFVLGFFVPTTIILTSSILTLTTIHKATKLADTDAMKQKMLKKQFEVLKMVLLVILSFFLCWTPYAILSMCGILGISQKIPVYLTVFPLQLAKSSLLGNALVLAFKNKAICVAGKYFVQKHFMRPGNSVLQSTSMHMSKLMNIQRKLRAGVAEPEIQ